jgi:hypothetical protein
LTILISLEDVNVLVSLGDIPGWIRDSLTSVVLLKYEGDSEAFEELKIDGLEAWTPELVGLRLTLRVAPGDRDWVSVELIRGREGREDIEELVSVPVSPEFMEAIEKEWLGVEVVMIGELV